MATGVQMSTQAIVQVTDQQVACHVSDETVILHLREGVYYGLNSVGSVVWRAVQTPHTVSQVVDLVVAEFNVERERCLADVRELLEELQRRQLVAVSEDPRR